MVKESQPKTSRLMINNLEVKFLVKTTYVLPFLVGDIMVKHGFHAAKIGNNQITSKQNRRKSSCLHARARAFLGGLFSCKLESLYSFARAFRVSENPPEMALP
jgi:hypothetical protein